MLSHLPEPEALILVAVLPNPRDLQIARTLGWYRLRANKAPKVINVDYIAFYLTAKFAAKKWQICHFAKVTGHELVTRQDLIRNEADHPRASDRYFKLQLGAIQMLDAPILATTWRRITFLYTTGAHFVSAATIKDLVVVGQERDLLWTALKERKAHFDAAETTTPQDQPIDMDLSLLLALQSLGRLDEATLASFTKPFND